MKNKFTAIIDKIGINPFVFVPEENLELLLKKMGKHKGKIPVRLHIDGQEFTQTLVKYAGYWRLYVNGPMLKATSKKVGDSAIFELYFDESDRSITPHPKLQLALEKYPMAKSIFDSLRPSLRLEIIKYISYLKTEESVDRNVARVIRFLLGQDKFLGRERP
ncbi:YdeI/OmpD-associated family protein [Olivibacter sp. SDN3]|uniref:YdeI/OmpD-associated family protein n=1 Tax=Olivibacter sp. SDN3 TaxID=2764720 RepID=UPI0021083190|nr:YdeI/OmpD-associated family protein [Olivibacter sp. SDN3]